MAIREPLPYFSARLISDLLSGRKEEDGSVKAGEVMYFDPFEHLPENTGNQSFEPIAIELKG